MHFADQLNRTIELHPFPPKRIISVVPSQTELLYDLGLDKEVIGITKFCIHPETWFRTKTRVGGTKQLNVQLIHELQPDLIVANKEENLRDQVEELANEFPVWISDIKNLQDAYDMIKSIGKLVGRPQSSNNLIESIKSNFQKYLPGEDLRPVVSNAAYLIWKDPYMTIGGDTFISDMMKVCGMKNMFEKEKRYPEITINDLSNGNCELLLLSSEPYPFKQKHLQELQLQLPSAKILLVDGEMFSWYGSRLKFAPAYLRQLRELAFNS